jgi:transposase
MTATYFLPKDYDTFIGIDVDKNSFSFTVKDHSTMKRSKKVPANTEHFYNYIQKTYPDKKVICAYEAGPTGFHLYDYLTQKGIPCLVVSPLSIPKASNERVKNNRIDSDKIAQHLRAGELKSVRVPQGPYRELRYLVKTRETYANNRKAAKQRIKALLLSANLYRLLKDTETNWSNCYITELRNIQCSDAVRNRLNMLLMDLEYARKQTLSIHRLLKTFCKDHKEINKYMQYLQSISGVGFITAITLLGKIGNPKHLKNVRELSAFVGLVPTEFSTGDTISKGSITRLGNKTLRFLLIEAAWVAIRHNTNLDQFYHRVKKRHHPRIAAKKAVTAVARKLTQIIYCVLTQERMYIHR